MLYTINGFLSWAVTLGLFVGVAWTYGVHSVAALAAVAADGTWDDDVVLLLSGQSDSCVANAGDMA